MLRFSLLLSCSLLASTLVGEHAVFAMNQNEDNNNAPQGNVIGPPPINWAEVAAFFQIHPVVQEPVVPFPHLDQKRAQ